MLAEGGIVTGPTLAMIGEKGPEAVVPLGKGGAGMGQTFNIKIDVSGVTDRSDKSNLQCRLAMRYRRKCVVGDAVLHRGRFDGDKHKWWSTNSIGAT